MWLELGIKWRAVREKVQGEGARSHRVCRAAVQALSFLCMRWGPWWILCRGVIPFHFLSRITLASVLGIVFRGQRLNQAEQLGSCCSIPGKIEWQLGPG